MANPEALAEVRSELHEVVGDGPLEAEHVPRLELLEAAIREGLRLRPAAPGSFRKSTAPMTLGGNDIPSGTVIMASSYLAHRQPDAYADPERFELRRFLGKKPDPFAWIPFGGGSRRCIGMAYAMYEMKVVLATLLSKVTLRFADGRPPEVTCRAVFHSPVRGLRVVAEA